MAKRPKKIPASPGMAPLPSDLEEFLGESGFRDPKTARKRLHDLFLDNAEMIALARISGSLKDMVGGSPDPDAALHHLARFLSVRGSRLQFYRSLMDHPALLDRFVTVVSSSRYLADILVRNPEYLDLLGDVVRLSRPRRPEDLAEEIERSCSYLPAEDAKLDALRRFHRREVLRIASADLLGLQSLRDLTRQFSDLADVFVRQCLAVLTGGRKGPGLIVLALGKWGGRELNYSSDIDLIFLTSTSGDVSAATKLAQRLIRALSEPTVEGVVYRVDIRLRPYGSEGALVSTLKMFEEYLKKKAQPPERQAMLKARVVAGEVKPAERFLRRIVPVLLKDGPGARKDVRSLKSRIEKDLHRKGQAEDHVKSSAGGIRDIEFVAQALQLEFGSDHPGVLTGNTLEALDSLEAASLLSRSDARALRDSYVFLRNAEHRLQLMGNKQVYRLPKDGENLDRLGRTLGFPGDGAGRRLHDAYDACARKVRSIFDRVLPADTAVRKPPSPTEALVLRQLGSAAERLDADLLGRACDLVDGIRSPKDVGLHARRNDRLHWTVAVAAADQPGFLSLISGLFTARKISILDGDCVRLRFETKAPPAAKRGRRPPAGVSRKLLDVFEVSLPKPVTDAYWKAFRNELAELAALAAEGNEEAARERVLEQVGETLRETTATDDPLLPVRIDVRNDPAGRDTELKLHSTDTLGFLFEFATTLTALRLDVSRAVIRTLDGEVYDSFWVTDLYGKKVVEDAAIEELRVAAALVKQFTHLLPRSPNPTQALRQFTALLRKIFARPDWVRDLRNLESRHVLATISKLMGVSRFLWEDFLLLQHENLFPIVTNVPGLERGKPKAALEKELSAALRSAKNPVDRLNEFKDRELFRIDLRHITRRSRFPEFMAALSDLGETVIAQACALVERTLKMKKSFWSICGLGKFGGRELGIASDLDLIFVYEDRKRGDGARFESFVSELLKTVKGSREGSFEIDLRLRPFGSGGAKATSLDSFREYYSSGGPARQFERMALVKLNPVAGAPGLGERVIEGRDAFVYSEQPLDQENIFHLRKRQAGELVAAGETSAKYSPGGLVDVEYFVQARQIGAGHRDQSVRVPNTLDAIDRLVAGGHLRGAFGSELGSTYIFLRRLLASLRVVRGSAKDSKIPSPSLREFNYLVRRLDYASPAHLEAEIRQRMSFARNVWNEL